MKRDYILGVLFFGSLWGASEVLLGGHLYGSGVRFPSVPLTIIAFLILPVARAYLPQRGSLVLVGTVAMLYKFLNTPFFACHLLAIVLLAVAYESVLHILKIREGAVLGIVATYLGYVLFALTITYVFRYHYWTEGGIPKIARYVGISGSMSACANALAVPAGARLGEILKERAAHPFAYRTRLATGATIIILSLWVLGMARWF
jgi:hypothetical protein